MTKLRECHYCGRPYRVAAQSYLENPFCTACLHERLRKTAEQLGHVTWVQQGKYAVPVRKL